MKIRKIKFNLDTKTLDLRLSDKTVEEFLKITKGPDGAKKLMELWIITHVNMFGRGEI
jgi:hypothetical protein